MTITIELPTELESLLRRRAEFARVDVSTIACAMLAENLAEEAKSAGNRRRRTPEELARRLDEWTALHPVLGHTVDDSRESIYEGCGE